MHGYMIIMYNDFGFELKAQLVAILKDMSGLAVSVNQDMFFTIRIIDKRLCLTHTIDQMICFQIPSTAVELLNCFPVNNEIGTDFVVMVHCLSVIDIHSYDVCLRLLQEMSGLCYFMLDQSRKDAEYCMENAFTTYLVFISFGNPLLGLHT